MALIILRSLRVLTLPPVTRDSYWALHKWDSQTWTWLHQASHHLPAVVSNAQESWAIKWCTSQSARPTTTTLLIPAHQRTSSSRLTNSFSKMSLVNHKGRPKETSVACNSKWCQLRHPWVTRKVCRFPQRYLRKTCGKLQICTHHHTRVKPVCNHPPCQSLKREVPIYRRVSNWSKAMIG